MKILFVATVQSHIAQFHLGAISLLKEHGFEVHVAARDNLAEKNGLQIQGADKIFSVPFDRSPFSTKNIKAHKELKKIIDANHYDMIHCNTPVGGIVARLAGRKARKQGTCIIYTAHGFHFYKGAPLKNWLIYYPIERWMAHYTDKLVTITEEDYRLAAKKFSCPVYHVHGVGIKTEKYDSVTEQQAAEFRKKNGWDNRFVILCTGELNANKNQSTLLQAMPEVIKKVPQVLLLLAGNGPMEKELKELAGNLKLEEYVQFLGYRADLEWYAHASDLTITASYREGLPLNVVEGMYCGKPVIASCNRGHRELIKNGKNGLLVETKDERGFADKIIRLYKDEEMYDKLKRNGLERAKKFTDVSVKKELSRVYFEQITGKELKMR